MPRALVTGSAGFIGYHLCEALLAAGWTVTGVDAMTAYYDPALKRARHDRLAAHGQGGFIAIEAALEDAEALLAAARAAAPDLIVHLAAQAGVRYSLENPRAYVDSNLTGAFNLLEAAQTVRPAHLLMASTSSVYGAADRMPFVETQPTDHPMTLYAATKSANEAMAHAYAHLHGIPVTLFRFFTVYGPWGRPDMALFKFTKAILQDAPIDLYNRGEMVRDFTYVDDLVARILDLVPMPPPAADARPDAPLPGDSLSPVAPWRVVNIGTGRRVSLLEFVEAIEAATGCRARRNLLPMQPGDVPATWADPALLEAMAGPRQATPLAEGVARFVDWYRGHYAV